MTKSTDDLQAELNSITDLNKYLKENEPELVVPNPIEYLLNIANTKDLSKAELIKRSGLERTFAYHLLDGSKTLTRDKALALGIAAGLSQEETQTLLKYAKLPRLYPRDARDNVILFCLNKGMTLDETNVTLYDLGHEIIE